jgi:hypothetical protein
MRTTLEGVPRRWDLKRRMLLKERDVRPMLPRRTGVACSAEEVAVLKSWSMAAICVIVVIAVELPAVAASATAAPTAWAALYSTAGDPVGRGANQLLQQSPGLSINASGTPAGVSVVTSGSHSFSFVFAPVQGSALSVGSYLDAQRAEFRATGHPGIDIYGDGSGCDSDSGQFTVEDIGFVNGTVSRLAIAFDQHCGAVTAALFGEVRFNEPVSVPLTIQASSLLLPANYVGVPNVNVRCSRQRPPA